MTRPIVGDLITEGMGMYMVRAALGGSCFEVESQASGCRVAIDFANSGYKSPTNAWRIAALASKAVR